MMLRPVATNLDKTRIHDCIGIGFGPSNIALAIALEERGLLENTIFLEERDEVLWHPGMLIEGTDIQHNPLRDFVTPRNPRSPYGFLSYLQSKNRLFDFLNLSAPYPPRMEYAEYVSWVAKQFDGHVRLDTRVSGLSYLGENGLSGLIEVQTGDGKCYHSRSAVIGCGRSRYIPPEFNDLLSENVIHSDDYLWARERWRERGEGTRIAVVGSSQSAAEILLDLSRSADVVGIARGFGFKQKDLSPFTERIYYPEFVDYFHDSTVASQNAMTRELWRSNYGAADHDVIDELNFRLYEQRITGCETIQLHHNSAIRKIALDRKTGAYTIDMADRHGGKRHMEVVHGIVFATGYRNFGNGENQEPFHPLLEGISDCMVVRDEGGPRISRDYLLETREPAPPVFLNGLCEATHGFGDAGSFSLLSIRGDAIAASIEGFIGGESRESETASKGGLNHVRQG